MLKTAFERAWKEKRPALVGYLPAGYPTVSLSVRALQAVAQHADIIEIGMPRVGATTPALHRAAARAALDSGATFHLACDLTRKITSGGTPVLLNSTWTTVARYGEDRFAAALASAGAAGVVRPDVDPQSGAAARWADAAAARELATVYFADRDQFLPATRHSTGCIYLPARAEAARNIDPQLLARRRDRVRAHAPGLPVIVGRGITSAEQAATLAKPGEGVAIGSALLAAAALADDPATAVDYLDITAGRFAAALRSRRRRPVGTRRAA